MIRSFLSVLVLLSVHAGHAQPITTAGVPGVLSIREAGPHSVRVTLRPEQSGEDLPYSPALADRRYGDAALRLTRLDGPVTKKIGGLLVEVNPHPLTVRVTTPEGR